MWYQARCGRCGENFNPAGLTQTQHPKCGGFASRVYEVHREKESLLQALIGRLASPSKGHPLIKFYPLPKVTVTDLQPIPNQPPRRWGAPRR